MKFKAEDIIILDDNELKRYQKELLKIAKDVVKVAEALNLDYSLSGGSVLGAVRHHGFIPWDDDIDINMTRRSYDKFFQIFEQKLGNRYYLQTPQEYPDLGIMVTQIREKNTIARRKYDWNEQKCGISIDLYIMENVFENPIKRFIQGNMSTLCAFAVSAIRYNRNQKLPKELRTLEKRKIRYSISKVIWAHVCKIVPLNMWINWCVYWNSLCKDDHSKYISIPTGRKHFWGEIYKRRNMCRFRKEKFETEKFNVPVWASQYLRMFYGDNYMKVPPVNKHEKHIFLELKY